MADLGSFRRAATQLNTTQPNISSRIATLETSLGVSLMERDAGSVRLTAKGEELLVYAREILAASEQFLVAVGESTLFNGVLRLGVTEMVVHTWLREFLQRFKETYPNIDVELTVDLSVNLEKEMAERTIDLAFQSGPFMQSMSGNDSLGAYPMVWVAAPKTKLHSNKTVSIEMLTQFPIITHARNTRLYQEMSEHFSEKPEIKARLVPSSNLSACVQMAVDGYGVAALLQPLVEKEIASGQLMPINYVWQPERLDFFARYNSHTASTVVKKAAELACELSNNCADKYR